MLERLFKNLFRAYKRESAEYRPLLKDKSFDDYLTEEIIASGWIKSEYRNIAHKAIIQGDFLKGKDILTIQEKRALNLNTRLKITRSLLNVLTDEGLKVPNLAVLTIIRHRAFHRHARKVNLIRIKQAGFSSVKFLSVKDERECEWCQQQSGARFSIEEDFDSLIQKNCTCDYSRCSFIACRS